MNTALFVARIIHNDLTIAQARSWQWWMSVTQEDQRCDLDLLTEFDVYATSGKANLEKTVQSGSNIALPAPAASIATPSAWPTASRPWPPALP